MRMKPIMLYICLFTHYVEHIKAIHMRITL